MKKPHYYDVIINLYSFFLREFSPSTVSAEPPEGASFTEERMTETPCH